VSRLATTMSLWILLFLLPTAAVGGPADPDSLVWVSQEAAIDSLNAYWRSLDSGWYEPLRLEDLGLGLTPVLLDSLTVEGDAVIGRMIAGRPWRVRLHPVSLLHYNRVQGLDLGGEIEIHRPGVRQPRLLSGLSYGLAWKRLSHTHRLSVPLATARLYDDGGWPDRPPWTWLALEAEGGRGTEWFAGDMRGERNLGAFFSGKDPNQYYDLAHWRAGLRVTPRPQLSLLLGAGGGRHRPLGVRTDWSLFGDRDEVGGNLAVTGLSRRTLYAGLQVRWRGLWLQGLQEWHRVTDNDLPDVAAADDGAAWYRHFVLKAMWQERDPWGDVWVLRGNWNSVDRQAPLEWKTYLGDYGTLRGYEALELVGDRGGWASLDVRWNVDLFRALRIPLLERLGLQPITFADWGRVSRREGPHADYHGAEGWRADVGVGLGKFLGLGGRLGSLRLFAAKPVGEGAGGRPWVFTLAVEGW